MSEKDRSFSLETQRGRIHDYVSFILTLEATHKQWRWPCRRARWLFSAARPSVVLQLSRPDLPTNLASPGRRTMSNLPLGDDLKALFDEVTSGKRDDAPVRAILVHNENGILQLIDSLPEEGSDKEDFNNVLGKLFAREPSKPGYALYRLDSKSPAGFYEWLNCAYRPEGAKVREKMQYSITQASLFRGLNEQHFLETVYVSVADCLLAHCTDGTDLLFPYSRVARLRNLRSLPNCETSESMTIVSGKQLIFM